MAAEYSLPPDITLEYLAEGAANIVYRITWPLSTADALDGDGTRTPSITTDLHTLPSANSSTTPPPTEIDIPAAHAHEDNLQTAPPYPPTSLHNRLLRLRKDVAWIPSYSSLHATQERLINPHFPAEDLVPQTLVLLPPSLLATANAALRAAEDVSNTSSGTAGRLQKRHGLYLAPNEPHGLLVADMSARADLGQALVEVKPKWQAQSPNAPSGATRCRTCALRAMRRDAKSAPAPAADTDFCPLALGSGDAAAVEQATAAILRGASLDGAGPALRASMAALFISMPLLPRLRALQSELDPAGILGLAEGAVPQEDFLVATTLRDCTMFVRVSGGGGDMEARLGDLDLKAPEPGKIDYWRGLERDLVAGGWYEGRASDGLCYLERNRGTG